MPGRGPASDLQIRRSRHIVQDRPLPVVRWADVPHLSAPVSRCPVAWQQPRVRGEAIAKRRPQCGPDAVAASWPTGGEEDGLALYRRACRVTGLDQRTLPVRGPACVGRASKAADSRWSGRPAQVRAQTTCKRPSVAGQDLNLRPLGYEPYDARLRSLGLSPVTHADLGGRAERICPHLLCLHRPRLSRCISCTNPCTNLVPGPEPVTDSLTLDQARFRGVSRHARRRHIAPASA